MEMDFKYFSIYMYTNLCIHALECGVVCLSMCINLGKASWLFMWFISTPFFLILILLLFLGQAVSL